MDEIMGHSTVWFHRHEVHCDDCHTLWSLVVPGKTPDEASSEKALQSELINTGWISYEHNDEYYDRCPKCCGVQPPSPDSYVSGPPSQLNPESTQTSQ